MIEENRSFGYRTVAHLLGFNKNTVQGVFQLLGWQVRRRPVGFGPRNLNKCCSEVDRVEQLPRRLPEVFAAPTR